MSSFGSVAVAILFSLFSFAQKPAQAPAKSGLERYRESRTSIFMNDFGELNRYRDANAALKQSPEGENRAVFFGDSITDMWKLDESFPGKPYLNRGIGGQTTPQMLVRFRQDVIELQPKAVVILAGTNDIAGNTGPMRIEDIEKNYASMAELAKVHSIRVVFASVLPVHNYTPQSQELFEQRHPHAILALNSWLEDYCAADGDVYLDYFAHMVDDKGLMRRELAEDGLHPNQAGYAIMAPLAQAAIEKALAGKGPPKAVGMTNPARLESHAAPYPPSVFYLYP
jgi:lysophospholipase L1-like esterase